MILYPNAKINLGLNVLRKREDGYHDLSSVFYPLKKVFDILEILPSKEYSFISTGISIPTSNNICEKAFQILKSEFKIPNIRIFLHKRIPVGAGLGGGSSDASFLLIGLNHLFNLGLDKEQLKLYAAQLGSDCPFFIENTPQYAEGRGDHISPVILDLSNYNIRIINTNINISTFEAYQLVKPSLSGQDLKQLITNNIATWRGNLKNDFELSIFNKYPVIARAKEKLYKEGAIYASMTGSGSVVYGIFK